MVRYAKILLAALLALALSVAPALAEDPADVIDSGGQEQAQEAQDSGESAPTLQEEEAKKENAGEDGAAPDLPEGVEVDEDGRMVLSSGLQMTLQTPSSLTGYKVTVKDSAGNSLTEKNISSSGTTHLETVNSDNHPTIIINSGQVQAKTEDEGGDGLPLAAAGLAAAAGALASGILCYFLGRRKGLKIIDELRDYIHEEKLD